MTRAATAGAGEHTQSMTPTSTLNTSRIERQRAHPRIGAMLACGLSALLLAPAVAQSPVVVTGPARGQAASAPEAGAIGGRGLALLSDKILTVEWEGRQVVDHGVLLVKDGKIEAVGEQGQLAIPSGYEVVDVGAHWLMPGMIDLHCHVGGTFDINDMVYLANPEMRAKTAVIPSNPSLEFGLAAGVTTVLFIPGSGTNVGGQGLLFKTGHGRFERAVVRDPGGLKIAQWGNPERWMIQPGKTFENYTIREILRRGKAYGKAWVEHEQGRAAAPRHDPQLEIFRELVAGRAQIAVHTQIYQVVLATLDIIKKEMGFDVFIDHGEFDSFKLGALAAELGVPAILGPRNQAAPNRGFINWVGDNPERVEGLAAGFWERGHRMVGFNTDSPVIPQQELQLQSAIGARYGLPDESLQTVRGHTVVPARTIGMGERLGSLQAGFDADIVVISGHPSDPRSRVEAVYLDGERSYDASHKRLW
jgi:hypothetical protein